MLFFGSALGFGFFCLLCLGFFLILSFSSANNADCLDHAYIMYVNFIVLYVSG